MSILDAISPYKLLIEIAVIGSLFAGASFEVHKFLEHERDIGRAEVQQRWDAQKLLDKQAADRQEAAWKEKYDLALKTGVENAQTLLRESAAAHAAADSLRSTNASLQQLLSTATAETARKYASAYANVFNDCVGQYQAMGQAAQGHANDARIISDAWPEVKVDRTKH